MNNLSLLIVFTVQPVASEELVAFILIERTELTLKLERSSKCTVFYTFKTKRQNATL